MPHWRKLHLKVVDSFDFNDMPDDFTRLLWVLMPLALDREGRGLDDPAWVKAKLMPLRRAVTLRRVGDALDWYATRGMIERYEANKRRYFWVPTFATYQGNTDREAACVIPEPPEHGSTTNSRPTHDQVMTNSGVGQPQRRGEENRGDSEGRGASAAPPKVKTANPSMPASVSVFQQAAGRLPAKTLWADMETAIGNVPGDLDFWGSVVRAWIAKGYNPGNIAGMFDFFKRRELPTSSGNGHSKPTAVKVAPPMSPEQVAKFKSDLAAVRAKQNAVSG
jgi:hypothetical protein